MFCLPVGPFSGSLASAPPSPPRRVGALRPPQAPACGQAAGAVGPGVGSPLRAPFTAPAIPLVTARPLPRAEPVMAAGAPVRRPAAAPQGVPRAAPRLSSQRRPPQPLVRGAATVLPGVILYGSLVYSASSVVSFPWLKPHPFLTRNHFTVLKTFVATTFLSPRAAPPM